jgi:hypothetical protein
MISVNLKNQLRKTKYPLRNIENLLDKAENKLNKYKKTVRKN